MTLKKLSIEGFKSISQLVDFEIKNLNVLIGANGAGKSNFVSLFRLLGEMARGNLDTYTLKNVPPSFFFNGPKVTPEISMHLEFEKAKWDLTLVITTGEKIAISKDTAVATGIPYIAEVGLGIRDYINKQILQWTIYHFHDTSAFAGMRLSESVDHYKYLEHDAGNIAPFLLNLKKNKPEFYKKIVNVIQLAAPFFNDFDLTPEQRGPATVVKLNWTQKGSDYPFAPYQLSDGTLRFICLATALLQPELPSCLVIDEPELGLHPYAIEVLAELIKLAACANNSPRIIITTQSPLLLDHFEPEDVVVVDRENGASIFKRLEKAPLSSWLEDYSLGEIWCKNLIAGKPSIEEKPADE